MVSKKKRELMLRIIDLAKSVRDRGVDPFEVEVEDLFQKLGEIFPKVKDREELLLDIRAVLGLTDIISQQGKWIKHKSSLLYFDPMLVQLKLRELSKKQLAYALVNSWHPIVELECIALPGMMDAREYWRNLAPLSERYIELVTQEIPPGALGWEEMDEIESEEDFVELMEKTWAILKEAAGDDDQISYWDFIDSDDFSETIRRAWMVSFLVSYGYATIELKPLEEKILLKPREEQRIPSEEVSSSVPISVSYKDWKSRVIQSG